MKKMKPFFITIFLVLVAVSITACTPSNNDSNSIDANDEKNEVSESTDTDTSRAAIGDYEVVIKDYELIKDDEGKDAVFIAFDFTNNSKDTISFNNALYAECFQNGVELDFATIYNGERDNVYDNKYKDIQPDTTIEVKEAYIIQDSENPLTVKVLSMSEILGGNTEGTAEKEFTINH